MKRLICVLMVGLLWTLVAPVFAQEGTIAIENDSNQGLDGGAILTAAQPLVDRGAHVVIYLVQEGEADAFTKRLQDDQLTMLGNIRDDLIAIFVSLDDRYMEIALGANWNETLDPRTEGILSGSLAPNLREGNFTLGFVRTLESLETVLATSVGTAGNTSGGTSGSGTTGNTIGSTTGGVQGILVPSPTSYVYAPYNYEPQPSDDGGIPATLIMFVVLWGIAYVVSWALRQAGFETNSGQNSSAPYYKSNWTNSSSRSSSSSYRSSSSSSSSRSGSFSGGSRRSGKW